LTTVIDYANDDGTMYTFLETIRATESSIHFLGDVSFVV